MLPSYQTSIAKLPEDLRETIRVTAREYRRMTHQMPVASATTMFSWFENGALFSCRVTINTSRLDGDSQDQIANLCILITEEDGKRNLVAAPAFQGVWDLMMNLGPNMPFITQSEEYAEITVSVNDLLR